MNQDIIEYHIADTGQGWGVFREGMPIAIRKDPADAIALANFFADRETLMTTRPVQVSGDPHIHRTLAGMRCVA